MRRPTVAAFATACLLLGLGAPGARLQAQTLDERDRQDEMVYPQRHGDPPADPGKPRGPRAKVPPAFPLTRPSRPPRAAELPSPTATPPPEDEASPAPSPTPTPRPDYLKTAEEIALEPIEETEQAAARSLVTVFQVQPRVMLLFGGDLQSLPIMFGGAVDWNFIPTGLDIFTGKMAVEMRVMIGRGQVSGADASGAAATLPVALFDAGVGVNYYFLAESTFQPFIGVGISYFSISFDSGGKQLTTTTTPLHLRAGVDVMLFTNAGLTIELGYLYSPLRLTNFDPANPATALPLDFPANGPGPGLAGFTFGLAGKIAF